MKYLRKETENDDMSRSDESAWLSLLQKLNDRIDLGFVPRQRLDDPA
jgi:hypothetical protein